VCGGGRGFQIGKEPRIFQKVENQKVNKIRRGRTIKYDRFKCQSENTAQSE
jgi:hypothetical protein